MLAARTSLTHDASCGDPDIRGQPVNSTWVHCLVSVGRQRMHAANINGFIAS